jgi:hypothetical protein
VKIASDRYRGVVEAEAGETKSFLIALKEAQTRLSFRAIRQNEECKSDAKNNCDDTVTRQVMGLSSMN